MISNDHKQITVDSDIIYYNILMTSKHNEFFSLAEYDVTLTQAIIDNPSDYYLSVIRFSVDGSTIPIFICPVIPDPITPTNVNNTPFVITMNYLGITYSTNLQFIPHNNTYQPAPPGVGYQDFSTSYYYVYYYTQFLRMINNGFTLLISQIVAANPGLESGIPIPYVIYEGGDAINGTDIVSLVIPNVLSPDPAYSGVNLYQTQYYQSTFISEGVTYYNNTPMYGPYVAGPPTTGQPPGTINILMNPQLYTFLDGIDSFLLFGGLNTQFLILVNDQLNNYYYPPQNNDNTPATQTALSFQYENSIFPVILPTIFTVAPIWFKFTQQYNVIEKWSTLSSIVLITQSIPVQVEYIPSTNFLGTPNTQNSTSSSFRSMLTDFIPPSDNPRSRYIYNPTGPFRLISLKTNQPLNRIDLKIYFSDQYQKLYPLYIPFNQSNSIKLMFIRKSLVKYNNLLS